MSRMAERVVLIGGGFGGLYAAKALRKTPVDLTLVDRRNFHLFQPLLYQVATGSLSPGDVAAPLRAILRDNKRTQVLLGEVVDIDAAARRVILRDGGIEYDTLIVATGATHSYFGHDEWAPNAPGLKTVEDAVEMRQRILFAFEAAEREQDPEQRLAWLTFVIVGGGPTGVELAGALGEIANDTLKDDFRSIRPSTARILLVDAGPRLLAAYPPELSAKAEKYLIELGVRSRSSVLVTGVDDQGVSVRTPSGTERITARTVLWAAGVKASPLGKVLADRFGASLDSAGRVRVEPDLTIPGHPEIFVIGDLANCPGRDGKPLPGVAPVAIQQGRYVAAVIDRRVRTQSRESPGPFHYRNKGNLATVGRARAVMDLGGIRFGGLNRGARLITGQPAGLPPVEIGARHREQP
ncbi:MAG: NAD(P)/FAD-dependent oxidoreductase [Acidobacteria bacterium]|nr:NAD(P)/FAD-dependent oxidoreductase [Acidobacteriota bacterium]